MIELKWKSNYALVIIGLAVAILLLYVFFSSTANVSAAAPISDNITAYGNAVAVQVTAAPTLPSGTQGLSVTYSAIQANVSSAGNQSKWINISRGGTVNITALVNGSLFIGSIDAQENSSISQIKLWIISARITAGNMTHDAYVQGTPAVIPVHGNGKVGQNSSVVISLDPIVAGANSSNSTGFIIRSYASFRVVNGSSPQDNVSFATLNTLAKNEYAGCRGLGVITLVPDSKVVWKDYLGVNAQLLWFTPGIYLKQLAALKALGLDWVRIDLHWNDLEPSQGNYSLSSMDTMVGILKQQHINADVYLEGSTPFDTSAPYGAGNAYSYPPANYSQFASFMAMLAERYPSIQAWEVWNEPNLPSFWPPEANATAYGRLLYASTLAIRRVAPDATVVMGGMAYYSQMPGQNNTLMLRLLGRMGAFTLNTVVAYHPYSEYPEGNSPCNNSFIQHATLVNSALHSSGVNSIWANEWGWSSYNGPPTGQAIIGQTGQAEYILRRLAIMSTMNYSRIFLFTLSNLDNRASLRDRSYGLLNIDGSPKLAYVALKRFLYFLGPVITPAAPMNVTTSVPTLYSITWARPNDSKVWIFWGSADGNATVSVNTGTLYDPLNGNASTLSAGKGGKLTVPVRTYLQMLSVYNSSA